MADFFQRTKGLLRDEFDAFESSLRDDVPVSIRFNPRKHAQPCAMAYSDRRDKLVPETICASDLEKTPWCETGYYLPRRPSFTFDPLFHAGMYYVQEASSMFLEQAMLRILADPAYTDCPLVVLDLCAAPGGKSTHVASLLPGESLLVCNEVIRSRCMILAENRIKWGCSNSFVTQNDPKAFSRTPHFFDIIVADLPCSGEGMFRKDPAARNEWSIEHVRLCAARQRRIVFDVWEALKPGGYLIYSTCTYNTEENEANVKSLSEKLGAEIVAIPTQPEWNIAGSLSYDMPVYRFFPHRTRGEGFFLAILRKDPTTQLNAVRHTTLKTRYPKKTASPTLPDSRLKLLIVNPEKFSFIHTHVVHAIQKTHEIVYASLSERLNIIAAGLLMGEYKGKDFSPSAALALSTDLNANAFPMAELTYEQAIAYLRRETIVLPANMPKGTVLVTYKKTPLGFVKNIGARANNLYPKEWRIIKNL